MTLSNVCESCVCVDVLSIEQVVVIQKYTATASLNRQRSGIEKCIGHAFETLEPSWRLPYQLPGSLQQRWCAE